MSHDTKDSSRQFTFIGQGDAAALDLRRVRPWGGSIGPWFRRPGEAGRSDPRSEPMHPANYIAGDELVHAVNTAVMLGKPLLLTGGPGTGKTQLAERIAWEFNLEAVLRFEAQSLSEAADLFYHFDLVGYLGAVELAKATAADTPDPPQREAFARLGPLGRAILRADPKADPALHAAIFGKGALTERRPSVVLIDEIDKASRDFPNDLLNGIERMEFELPDLQRRLFVPDRLRPIVIITSNQERELPAPFLRRCTFFHIDPPKPAQLAAIIARRFFAGDGSTPPALPEVFQQLLGVFENFRTQHAARLQYTPSTQELIDWTTILEPKLSSAHNLLDRLDALLASASAVSKQRDDQALLRTYLQGLKPAAA